MLRFCKDSISCHLASENSNSGMYKLYSSRTQRVYMTLSTPAEYFGYIKTSNFILFLFHVK